MSSYKTVTNYVKTKYWPDGRQTLSFKLDAYTKKILADIPEGTFIQINEKSQSEGDVTHYMSYKEVQRETDHLVDAPY